MFIRLTYKDSEQHFRLNTNVIAFYYSACKDNTFIQLIPLEFGNGTADNFILVKESVEEIDEMLGVDF